MSHKEEECFFINELVESFLINGSNKVNIILNIIPRTRLPDEIANIRSRGSRSHLLKGVHSLLSTNPFIKVVFYFSI